MLNIYGLFAMNEMPIMQLIERDVFIAENNNLLELSRHCFQREANKGRTYDAIMVVIGADTAQVFVFK